MSDDDVSLDFVRYHWASRYDIGRDGARYAAVARYGDRDRLTAATPGELLGMIRRHYQPPADEPADSPAP
jgi:hypothetical protein